MGLESPQSGEINLQGKDIASLKPEKLALSISFVTTDKVRIANLRCKDVVALGRAPYTNWLGQLQPEDRKIVDNAISWSVCPVMQKRQWIRCPTANASEL